MPGNSSCIIIFTKLPVPGKVKTRLVPPLTKVEACELYKKMAEGTLKKAAKTRKDIVVCYYPKTSSGAFKKWLGKGLKYIPQRGRTLGAKMGSAFKDVFKSGYDNVLLIGCDIPGNTATLLDSAFDKLNRSDALLGPAKDGGYYMIGFKKEKYLPEVFERIKWSTPAVFAETMKIFKSRGYRMGFARKLSDVDTAEDIL